MKRKIFISAMVMLIMAIPTVVFGQTSELEAKFIEFGQTISRIVWWGAGLLALIGGVTVAWHYFQGSDRAQKMLVQYIIGILILGVIVLIIDYFLGTNATGAIDDGTIGAELIIDIPNQIKKWIG